MRKREMTPARRKAYEEIAKQKARDAKDYLRDNAPAACRKLVSMLNGKDDKTALAAAREILDRAWGKAVQQTEAHVEIDSRIAMRAEIRAALVAEAEGRLDAPKIPDDAPKQHMTQWELLCAKHPECLVDGAQSTD